MPANTFTPWLFAILLAIAAGAAWHLDDHSHEWQQSANLQDAINADARAQRIAKVAAFKCGTNAGYLEKSDGTIACTTKKGKRTGQEFQLAALQ
jgi:hypothetical protein